MLTSFDFSDCYAREYQPGIPLRIFKDADGVVIVIPANDPRAADLTPLDAPGLALYRQAWRLARRLGKGGDRALNAILRDAHRAADDAFKHYCNALIAGHCLAS
jgi:hypothetical protein